MSEPEGNPGLTEYVAAELRAAADPIVDAWIGKLRETVGVRPSRLLPTSDLHDHIPDVIRRMADYLSLRVEAIDAGSVARLRMLAELRRGQGFDIEELLLEFEALGRCLFDRFELAVESYPRDAGAPESAELARRLHEAVMAITHVTVRVFREEESEQRRELSGRLSTYARALTHELKSPLNAASASAKILQEDELPEDELGRLRDLLVRSLERMNTLIEDVRELAVVEGAQSEMRRIPLRQAVESVFEEVRRHAAERGVALRVDGDLPDIEVDAGRVEIALMNLVANAVKYSDPDKEERWVRIGATPLQAGDPMEGGWAVHVADNGLGIPKRLQDKVFHRHFRAHPEVAEGTGLGLSIAHQLATQRGGEIRFESEEGKGTTFYLVIPEAVEKLERRVERLRP